VTTSPNLSLKVLWRKYDFMIAYILAGKQLLILWSRPACHTLSNACEKGSRAISSCVHVCIYFFDDSVYLFCSCMPGSESKLVIGDYFLPFNYLKIIALAVEVFQIISIGQAVNWFACTIRQVLPICPASGSRWFVLLSIEVEKNLVWVLRYKVGW